MPHPDDRALNNLVIFVIVLLAAAWPLFALTAHILMALGWHVPPVNSN